MHRFFAKFFSYSFPTHWYRYVFLESRLSHIGLIRDFVEYAARKHLSEARKNVSFPFFTDKRWHEFLWRAWQELGQEFPELACISYFEEKEGAIKFKFLREMESHGWYEKSGNGNSDLRFRLKGFREETPLLRHHPGLAEKLYAIASSIPGFLV